MPLDPSGKPDFEQDDRGDFDFCRGKNQFWQHLNELYVSNRPKGKATPHTLWESENHQNKLTKQLVAPGAGMTLVAYNSSGKHLRAARIPQNVLIDSKFYYLRLPMREGAFLASILNAPCLQLAYQYSRTSDRDFHLHPIRKIPIPKFDPDNNDHLELVELCELSEVAAQEVISGLPPNTGQIKASNTIRHQLMHEGLADAIDDVVRRVLPSHSMHEYTDDIPHPWS